MISHAAIPPPVPPPIAHPEPTQTSATLGLPMATALRAAFRRGYKAKHLRADLLAGVQVAENLEDALVMAKNYLA